MVAQQLSYAAHTVDCGASDNRIPGAARLGCIWWISVLCMNVAPGWNLTWQPTGRAPPRKSQTYLPLGGRSLFRTWLPIDWVCSSSTLESCTAKVSLASALTILETKHHWFELGHVAGLSAYNSVNCITKCVEFIRKQPSNHERHLYTDLRSCQASASTNAIFVGSSIF